MRCNIFYPIAFLTFHCTNTHTNRNFTPTSDTVDKPESNSVPDTALDGEWHAIGEDQHLMITRMVFKDSNVTLYTIGDTLLNYRYKIVNNHIQLHTYDGATISSDSIISLSKSKLTLHTIINQKVNYQYEKQ